MYINLKVYTGIEKKLNYCSFFCDTLVVLYGISQLVLRYCCYVINVWLHFETWTVLSQ